MLGGGTALLASWYAARSWAATEEAALAARQLSAPSPRWVNGSESASIPRQATTPRPLAPSSAPEERGAQTAPAASSTPRVTAPLGVATTELSPSISVDPVDSTSMSPADAMHVPPAADADLDVEARPHADPEPEPDPADAVSGEATADDEAPAPHEPRALASSIEIVASEFRFLDPPEPGAQARVALHVHNHDDLPTGPLRLTLSVRWLNAWRVVDADPPVVEDRVQRDGRRAFDFPGLDGGAEGAFELHLVATDDAVDPPELRLALVDGDEIGRSQPETVAPRPRPGPARALEIPRLGLRAAVVATAWEPPAFVVGQLRETANLSEGNTVLIGHLTGLAGSVFARLEEVEPGDEVVATSRGLDYRFVVSETMVLPGDDSVPIQPTDTPRLTLMTCVGDWDPIGHDYSHRLWVVAEPPELAEATLAGQEPGPLTRLLGLAPDLTIVPPADRGPSPKEVAAQPAELDEAPPPLPGAEILVPGDGARVDERVIVRGRRTEAADPSEPLWLVVRPEIEGSRWYPYDKPLSVGPDGTWEAALEIGGGPGIRHVIVAAPVDPATDSRLRRQVAERPGEPLAILPDAFESGARIVVERR
jgi:hypothetical protein